MYDPAPYCAQLTPLFDERGAPTKGGKANAKVVQCNPLDSQESACTLYSVFTKNKIFKQGKEFVTKYISRNVSWEVHKAIAIQPRLLL